MKTTTKEPRCLQICFFCGGAPKMHSKLPGAPLYQVQCTLCGYSVSEWTSEADAVEQWDDEWKKFEMES